MSEKYNLGVIGGTFDPVHIGHLAIAEDARENFDLTKIIFMPARRSPHKTDVISAPAEARLEMVRIATMNNPWFGVSDAELRREGPSYTFDTLENLQEENPSAQIFFIIGSDSLGDLHAWHRAKELISRFKVVTVARPGEDELDAGRLAGALGKEAASQIERHYLKDALISVSATDIRKRVRDGRSIRYLVPAAVERYILRKGLYIQA